MRFCFLLTTACATAVLAAAMPTSHLNKHHAKRQDTATSFLPAEISDYKTIRTERGPIIRYKEPGKVGICETTPGVNSYSGYIDLDDKNHVFFWFQESRNNPANDDLTLFLQGGPGSDSILGMFEELGACRIKDDLSGTVLNPWSFSNVSNMLYISQPVGVGLSYQDTVVGSVANITGTILSDENTPDDSISPHGRYSSLDPTDEDPIDTSDKAAAMGYEVVQAFISGMQSFDGIKAMKPKRFNIWAESYGGHWGPAYMDYFLNQQGLIANGTTEDHPMELGFLGLINPFVDAAIQDPWGPQLSVSNNWNITALNATVYDHAVWGMDSLNGCRNQIEACKLAAQGVKDGLVDGFITAAAANDKGVNAMCSKAQNMCRDNVELPYSIYSGRGVYDIRHPSLDPAPPMHAPKFLNQGFVQEAIGSALNYSGTTKLEVFNNFQTTGDWVFPNSKRHIEKLLDKGVRVAMVFGDADYVCNWHGGEALSLAIEHTNKDNFAAAGYQAFEYAATQYGEVREHGNLAFVRVYDAGHLVPYYQPQAAFAIHNRTIHGRALADGLVPISDDYSTAGPANSTHTQTAEVPPSDPTSEEYAAYAARLLAEYDAKFRLTPNGSNY